MTHMTVKASPRPAKGTAQKQRRARRRQIESRMLIAKARAKQRDYFRCRRCGGTGSLSWPVEAAHIRDAGMGGDGGVYSSDQRDYVTLCRDCHQGPRSVHSGHIRIVAGDRGGDGVVRFEDVTPGKSPSALLRE
jgi:hypothetical protein